MPVFEPLTFFSFLPVGLICVFVGMVVLMPLSKIFLTKRDTEKSDSKNKNKSLNELAREYQLSENLFRIQIPEKSIVAGKTIVELNIRQQYHLNILEVRRSVSSQSRLLKTVNQKLADPGTVLRFRRCVICEWRFRKSEGVCFSIFFGIIWMPILSKTARVT